MPFKIIGWAVMIPIEVIELDETNASFNKASSEKTVTGEASFAKVFDTKKIEGRLRLPRIYWNSRALVCMRHATSYALIRMAISWSPVARRCLKLVHNHAGCKPALAAEQPFYKIEASGQLGARLERMQNRGSTGCHLVRGTREIALDKDGRSSWFG